jgi:flagellar biosynthesis component FlhA
VFSTQLVYVIVPTLHPLVLVLATIALNLVVTWYWTRNNRSYSETREEKKAKEEAEKKRLEAERLKDETEKQWKEGRIRETDDIKASIKELARTVMQNKLDTERDFAAATEILKKNVETTDKLTGAAERLHWHGKTLDEHKEKFKEIHDDISELRDDIKILNRAKP